MFDLVIFLSLLLLGFSFGVFAEWRHYRSIRSREKRLLALPAMATKLLPLQKPAPQTVLVSGSVVISVDYFKRFVAGLRNLVGGRVKSYESLLDRGRREALLRMKEEAEVRGANMIFNVKLETASISKGKGNNIGSIEVHAYGTALIPRQTGH